MTKQDQQVSILPKILMALKYQFQPGFLIYMVALSASVALLPLLGSLAAFVMLFAGIAYTYKCYDSASLIVEGDDDASYAIATNIEFSTPIKYILVQFVIAFVLLSVLRLVMGSTSSIEANPEATINSLILSATIVNVFITITSPAVIMLMIQTQSFRQTINPANWLTFIKSMGTGKYLLMCGILFAFSLVFTAKDSVLDLFLQYPSIGIGLGVFLFSIYIGFTFTFVAYCSRTDFIDNGESLGVNKEVNDDLRISDKLWHKGKREDAVQSLTSAVNNTKDWQDKFPLLQQLFVFYDHMEQPEKKEGWKHQMIQQVVTKDHKNYPLISDIIKDKVANSEKIQTEHIYPLANLALINDDAELVIKLTNGFNKSHPNHVDLPGILFVQAKAYKKLRKAEQAFKILTFLIKQYPNDAEISDFKALLSDVKTKIKAKQELAKSREKTKP